MDIYEHFLNKHRGFTEIQERAIPYIEAGDNCLIVSPTGSGKTETAMLPIIKRISGLGKDRPHGISVLYITPLKALNRDMMRRLEDLCRVGGLTIGVRHGDTTQSERSRQARMPPDILVTTPETLQSVLPTKYIGNSLSCIKVVVVDEIHELYYNKRGAQLSIALERLAKKAGEFQRVGISATINNCDGVARFLCGERRYRIFKVDRKSKVRVDVDYPENLKMNDEMKDLSETFGLDKRSLARISLISDYIKMSKSCLIFSNTRQVAEALGSRLIHLDKMKSMGGIGVHHGSLDRAERVEIEDEFKGGRKKAIIATSSLELGIDIGSIDFVVQYGSPRQALRLLQRMGRSGHAVGGTPHGAIIANSAIDYVESNAVLENANNGILEDFKPNINALDVLSNQICGIALDNSRIRLDELDKIVRGSSLYKDMRKDDLVTLLKFMDVHSMIRFDNDFISSSRRTRIYYYEHLSVIPNTIKFRVKNIANNKYISQLDEKFVLGNISESSVFITKGLPWKVIGIDNEVINVEPCTELSGAIPDWYGEDIPISRVVARTVLNILKTGSILQDSHSADVKKLFEEQREYFTPAQDAITIEKGVNYQIVFTFLGSRANELLSKVIGYFIGESRGFSINIRSTPYLIFIENSAFNFSDFLKRVDVKDVEDMIYCSIVNTDLFVYKFIEISKMFGIVEKGAALSKNSARKLVNIFKDTPVYHETLREILNNYFDIAEVKDFLVGIKAGSFKVRIIEHEKLSPLSDAILNSDYHTKELIMPIRPSEQLLNSFRDFLLSKTVRLLCTYCGINFYRKIEEIRNESEIRCISCGSKMLCTYNDDYNNVLKKVCSKKKLKKEDLVIYKNAVIEARLFNTYGGKAALALSTYGVGPSTAARTLRMFREEDVLLYTDLIDAQRQFIKNKKYWVMR
ncbi:MAG: DEAD/DEAH box helicase [Candidatus Marsarchaeota archaeon]|nr:DEAD/DEAH box helicase [Candidatus Marsarchaeota archaeon]